MENLKSAIIFLLIVLAIEVPAQTNTVIQYPDVSASVLTTSAEVGDSNTEWKYWLVQTNKDTLLFIRAYTHDDFRPVCYWTKSSHELIYEDRGQIGEGSRASYKIKIYNLQDHQIRFETIGFIWGQGEYNFDSKRGLLFYFKQIDDKRKFALMVLNVATEEIKTLTSFSTSGDPITGAPQVQSIDLGHRQLILTFESDDFRTEKISVDF